MYEMWEIETIFLGIFLILLTVKDIRTKTLPVSWLAGGTLTLLVLKTVSNDGNWQIYAAGAAAGGSFFIMGKLTREGIGYGDCWIMTIIGFVLGIWKFCVVALAAFLLCAVTGIYGMFIKKWSRKKRVPFMPYLLSGYLGVMFWQCICEAK